MLALAEDQNMLHEISQLSTTVAEVMPIRPTSSLIYLVIECDGHRLNHLFDWRCKDVIKSEKSQQMCRWVSDVDGGIFW